MIYLALVAIVNTALAAYLVYENRKLTYVAMSRHVGDLTNIEKAQKRPRKPVAETSDEKPYHTWRNPNEGVGP
jgi:hypothetical protein